MFLARLLETSLLSSGVEPTSLARWLREHPPRRSMAIRERTSWSCHHGVARWMDECGCVPPGACWKAALRGALDRLAAALDAAYLEALRTDVADPLALRHDYIRVMLGELPAAELIAGHAGRHLPDETVERIGALLEAQRERQRMFTSCGWFFEDFDRIEPKNNVAYAARAVGLTRAATGTNLAPLASEALRHVVSPRSGLRGDQVFAQHAQRASIPLAERLPVAA
jgi:hypothetical protein